jgi:hypothetical protein
MEAMWDEADHLGHAAAHRRGQHLHGLENAIGIDEKAAPEDLTRFFGGREPTDEW